MRELRRQRRDAVALVDVNEVVVVNVELEAGRAARACRPGDSASVRSVAATHAVAATVCPRVPKRRTDRRVSSAAAMPPNPESEPKRPHSAEPQPRSSRAKT